MNDAPHALEKDITIKQEVENGELIYSTYADSVLIKRYPPRQQIHPFSECPSSLSHLSGGERKPANSDGHVISLMRTVRSRAPTAT
jgi:hypothetical protein